ncbi:ribbon-helix-helix domain-containing protein [Polycladidibacter hongkongensis]|uniref:ribbon-helix-helix domain-containing protein n=1 Tax=Polycladidibacter hongkongensis TaxID=1647556 RepID=UPI00082DD4C4|nr:ribbon-helix-helix domain-containing protein [Pseudovibrio hongkongensis]
MSTLVKRSITLHGHRTSIALEPEFWQALDEMQKETGSSFAATIARIDDNRDPQAGLSSCIRVAILSYLQTKLGAVDTEL